jgi:transcriptional regulator with XRE-family HTH domain
MKKRDNRLFGILEEFEETPDSLAFSQALDFMYLVADQMDKQGISKTELAKKMGISKSHLSQLFDSGGSITLKTLARFQIALGFRIDLAQTDLLKQAPSDTNLVGREHSGCNTVSISNPLKDDAKRIAV